MVVFPPCKINLGLNIISRRDDGYHNLATCFYPVAWCDVLEVIPSGIFSLHQEGRSVPGSPENNLCVKAWALLNQEFNIDPVEIYLLKHIPTGAGLGGGSSDGAYTLRVLNKLYDLSLSEEALVDYAARLGSDCPFFVYDSPMLGSGRGEVLDPVEVSLKGRYLVIVTPDVHVATAEAFSGITARTPDVDIRSIVTRYPVEEWKGVLRNDFEFPIFARFPQIESIKEKLYSLGAVYASLTGTGSSVYGIFDTEPHSEGEFPGYTYWAGQIN